MSLNARSVAVQGIGYSARLKAVQGLSQSQIFVIPNPGSGGSITGTYRDALIHFQQIATVLGFTSNFKVNVSYCYVSSNTAGIKSITDAITHDPNAKQRNEDELILMTLTDIIKGY